MSSCARTFLFFPSAFDDNTGKPVLSTRFVYRILLVFSSPTFKRCINATGPHVPVF